MTPHEKRPRQYAQEIATLPTAAARNKALGAVPPEMRDTPEQFENVLAQLLEYDA